MNVQKSALKEQGNWHLLFANSNFKVTASGNFELLTTNKRDGYRIIVGTFKD
jgi:hypothetical protein